MKEVLTLRSFVFPFLKSEKSCVLVSIVKVDCLRISIRLGLMNASDMEDPIKYWNCYCKSGVLHVYACWATVCILYHMTPCKRH